MSDSLVEITDRTSEHLSMALNTLRVTLNRLVGTNDERDMQREVPLLAATPSLLTDARHNANLALELNEVANRLEHALYANQQDVERSG